ncbi:hydroxymethylpyrimidine/phosphomethylpyrimidine kinase [Flavobacterium sp. ZT3R18]|uniref:hydroxymethylpyrimidine/phosphomethylpyrimidine kinase n=1 Tax=Flavobacterium sp. ZT3R18 TaxID=2594429 RepID=UPI00117A8E53|nr:hydroxymethylpyrimidine/phosphomethylpyrimidine kinase [Flavobacterium sp. ZT3R18]TRX38580.1 hydroxymethylpyrimidine/phosphomethylpyrimidine kinase [Flavobacterium sp. ZT3R18]
MSENRPIVLSIAGFDPSGGAGVLADIKTFEQHKVYGFAINTANTIQTENEFHSIQWTPIDFVIESIITLLNNYPVKVVKIGIVPSLSYLNEIIIFLKKHSPTIQIIWDPILKSSTEFDFLTLSNQQILIDILNQIDLITPNYNEMQKLFPNFDSPLFWRAPIAIGRGAVSVLLKGGHNPTEIGVDYLFTQKEVFRLMPKETLLSEKHGSGCVLSAAITANLALGQNLKTACENAKIYTENYLLSNPTKLGFHYV